MHRLMAIFVVLVATAAPAAAQPYQPSSSGALQVSDDRPRPGEAITVTGQGFKPASTVTITFESQPVELATTTAAADGSFSRRVTIPATASAGTHTLRATGQAPDGSTLVLVRSVTVESAPGATRAANGTGGDGLPRTGSSSTERLVLIGAVCAVLGSLLVVAVRRRRHRGRLA